MKLYLNDGSADAPKLRIYLNTDNLLDLPKTSEWTACDGQEALKRLKADGFEGVQIGGFVDLYDGAVLPYCGLGRVSEPEEAEPLFAKHSERGDSCITLHVGWGMESDQAMDRLVDAILSAAEKHSLPAFIETHRATITQDMWRTVELCKRIPEIRFNADFSHFYCGQEMPYGDFDAKLDFMQPIFDRTGFMHGRIASSGFMQAPIETATDRPKMVMEGGRDYLSDFKKLWSRAMQGFKDNAELGSILVFAPELLSATYFYGRVFPDTNGVLIEESDRYAQAKLYAKIARDCFV